MARTKQFRPLEKDVQAACIHLLKVLRITHWRVNSRVFRVEGAGGKSRLMNSVGVDGHSDLFAMLPMRVTELKCPTGLLTDWRKIARPCFIELKREGGKQSEAQQGFQALVEEAGAIYLLVHSVDELIEGLRAHGVPC